VQPALWKAYGGKFGAVHGIDMSASFLGCRDSIGEGGSAQQRALWTKFAST